MHMKIDFRMEGKVLEHVLAIKKIPDVAGSMTCGRIYVLMHDAELGLEIVCQTLLAACAVARANWITATPAAYLGVHEELRQEVAECLRKDTLRIFQAQTGERNDLCHRMLQELDFLGVEQGSLIIVEGVGQFIEQATRETWDADVTAWQQWAERSGCTVLWMCPRRPGEPSHKAEFQRMAHRFSGLARLRKSADEARYDVFYWFAHAGLMTHKSFRLNSNSEGNCWVVERDTSSIDAADTPLDEEDVFAMRAALPEGRTAPNDWRVFDTSEQMCVALSSAHACTVIFHYNVGSPIEQLAQHIFELRRLVGPYIKIAVKEAGGRLRHSNELLLLSVGVNLLIPSDMGYARMLNQLKSIQGQIFSRALPANFEEASASVNFVAQTGYLAPGIFKGVVAEVMELTRSLEVYNALVRLYITEGLGVLEALRSCTMRRSGDLFTADKESVYIFLSACEEQDISATLDRVFRLPVSVIFSDQTRFLTTLDIAAALAEFNRRAIEKHYADFTSALESLYSADEHRISSAVAATAPTQSASRRAFTAVPHVLLLRTTQE
jgi:cellulose biosynthesis protein BcsE